MADFEVHYSQAGHNRKLADKLISEPPYHDWGITAAFYSAIHYFECWLYTIEKEKNNKHTETSIPRDDDDGKLKYSPHAWRETLVRKKLNKDAFKAFRKLRDSSETARYLSFQRISQTDCSSWLNRPASEYFTPDVARKLVDDDLRNFIDSLKLLDQKESHK